MVAFEAAVPDQVEELVFVQAVWEGVLEEE